MKVAITKLQRTLTEAGYSLGEVDGIGGRKTAAALRSFLIDQELGVFKVTATAREITLKGPAKALPEAKSDLPWMRYAYGALGLHERTDNAELRKFLRSDGPTLGDPAQFPWCGDFVETCINLGLPDEEFDGALADNPYLARNWDLFGRGLKEGCPGAVCRFWRGNPSSLYGHVFFYVGEDDTRIYGIGGNHSNEVNVAAISKDRLVSYRWPLTTSMKPGAPVYMSMDMALSVNEA